MFALHAFMCKKKGVVQGAILPEKEDPKKYCWKNFPETGGGEGLELTGIKCYT